MCFDYVSDINTSLLCAACDPEVQSSIDFESKSVLLNAQALLDFKKSCLSFVNLNILHLYPFLQKVQKLVYCKSTEQPMYSLNSMNLLSEEQMEDVEIIFSKAVSFGAETNVNSEGDFRYITELYQKIVKVVDMTGDRDFILKETPENNQKTTEADSGLIHNRRLGFVNTAIGNLSAHDENEAKKYKRYLRAKSNGDMIRMEKIHIMQKALNVQEQREVATLDRQWRNRMRRARRLTQRIFDIDDETLNGNKPVFNNENGDKLFMKKMPARRLAGSDDSNEGDDESDGDDGEKSDANAEDDDDEDSDDGDEDTPDIKKRIENLNEICTYHWWQGDFMKMKECWVKDNKDIKKYVANLVKTLKCMDEEATKKDSDGDNTITIFKKDKKCLEKGDQAQRNKDDEEDDKKTKKKDKEDKKKNKDKKKKKADKKKKKEKKEEKKGLLDNTIHTFLETKDRFILPSDIPRKSVDKKQLKCFNQWKKFILDEKTKNEEKWKKYKKDKKCNEFKKFKDCDKDKDKAGCKKEKDSLLKLLKAYHHFEKYFVKPLEKLEEGMKDGVYNKKNAKTLRGRRLDMTDQRRLGLVDHSLMKTNKMPSNAFMAIQPSDLHHLKSYISDGTHYAADNQSGPSHQERRLVETYFKKGKESYDQEVTKLNFTKKQKDDLGRKLKMMEDFHEVTKEGKDAKLVSAGADIQQKKVDGVKAANATKTSHVENTQATNVSPDGLTSTSYATSDISTSQNDNSTEALSAVQVKGTKMLQGAQLTETATVENARRLEKTQKEDDDDDDDDERRLNQDDSSMMAAADKQQTVTSGEAHKTTGNALHIEKTQAKQVSSDGLTVQKYNTEDITKSQAIENSSNVSTVKALTQKADQLLKVEDISRRLDRKLEEVDGKIANKAAKFENFERLNRESKIGFSYSEQSGFKTTEFATQTSGFKGFAINPTQIKNVNA